MLVTAVRSVLRFWLTLGVAEDVECWGLYRGASDYVPGVVRSGLFLSALYSPADEDFRLCGHLRNVDFLLRDIFVLGVFDIFRRF